MNKLLNKTQTAIVVALITNDKGEILLARRNEPESKHIHNKWEFIGGGIEFGESPEVALKREVKEEAGVDVKIIRLLPEIVSHVWKLENGNEQQVIILSYECKIAKGEPTAGLDQEIGALTWVAVEDIPQYDTLPNIYETAKLLNVHS